MSHRRPNSDFAPAGMFVLTGQQPQWFSTVLGTNSAVCLGALRGRGAPGRSPGEIAQSRLWMGARTTEIAEHLGGMSAPFRPGNCHGHRRCAGAPQKSHDVEIVKDSQLGA